MTVSGRFSRNQSGFHAPLPSDNLPAFPVHRVALPRQSISPHLLSEHERKDGGGGGERQNG
jgi:hypothetical protein